MDKRTAQNILPLPVSFTDRKSTRLNSSHSQISYAVFCLKKKKKTTGLCVKLFEEGSQAELYEPRLVPPVRLQARPSRAHQSDLSHDESSEAPDRVQCFNA